jgi:HEAT repeat protein
LVAALEHPFASLREGAAVALGALGDELTVAPLTAALRDRDARVRAAALTSLVRIQPQRAMEALRDADPEVRASAVTVLAGASSREAAGEALIELLGDGDAMVRSRAARELGTRGDRRAVRPLTALLKREPPGSRAQEAAAHALVRLGAGRRIIRQRSSLASPLVLWAVGMALFGLGVAVSASWGMGLLAGAVGVAGFLLLVGFRVQAARGEGQWFYPGGELGGGDAVWLGASVDTGGWSDGGGADGGGDFGGGGDL